MFGWFNADAARASRLNRVSVSASAARPSEMNLIPTNRCRRSSSAAKFVDNAVMRNLVADQRIRARRAGALLVYRVSCRDVDGGRCEKPIGVCIGGQERSDLAFKVVVATTRGAQKGIPLFGRPLQNRIEEAIDLTPSISIHVRFAGSARGTARLSRSASRASP